MGDLPPDVAARLEQARQEAILAKREGVLLTRRPLRPDEEPRSYIGGLPRLREDLEWPLNKTTGLPLNFIAQIDLRDVPRPRGVFFPAEGLLWFFADVSEGRLKGDDYTRVLFDPHPRDMARERAAPANLRPFQPYDSHGWLKAQHPRAFVEPPAGLFFDLFDTFYDEPYLPQISLSRKDMLLRLLRRNEKREEELNEPKPFGPGVYSGMIEKLREEALHRAIGPRERHDGYWFHPNTGFGEAHWPATSIDAEYALMRLAIDSRLATDASRGLAIDPRFATNASRRLGANHPLFSTAPKDPPCPPEVVTDLAAQFQEQIRMMRSLGARPLVPAERVAIKALIKKACRGVVHLKLRQHPVPRERLREMVRDARMDVLFAIRKSYPYAAFEILSRMPDAEKYVPAELLDPYQEWTVGGQLYFHQMFGHASSLQNAAQRYQDDVLLLEIAGSPTLGFCSNSVMHYWISKQDLADGRFDRVEATWESD